MMVWNDCRKGRECPYEHEEMCCLDCQHKFKCKAVCHDDECMDIMYRSKHGVVMRTSATIINTLIIAVGVGLITYGTVSLIKDVLTWVFQHLM